MGTKKRSRLTFAELLVTAAIIAVLLLLPASSAAGPDAGSDHSTLQTQEKAGPPDLCARVLPRFDVCDEDLPTVVARLSGQHRVLCGLALVPDRSQTAAESAGPPFKRIHTVFHDTHVACILTTLTELDRAFAFRAADDFATIGLSGVFSEEHPLQTVIPEFAARDVPWPIALFGGPGPTDAVASAPLFRSEALPSDFRVTMETTGRALTGYPTITYSATNRRLIDVINDIARQLGLSWRILDRTLIGGSGVEFFMGTGLPTTPDLAAPLPIADPTAPVGGRPPVSTGEAAIAHALRFFEGVGWKAERGGRYPESEPEPIAAFPVRRHGADCWEVTLNDLTARVDRGRGGVHLAIRRGVIYPRAADAPTISASLANNRALACLENAGVPVDDLVIDSSYLTRDRDDWYVYFTRAHNGFLFWRDGAVVILLPDDGSIGAFGYHCRSPLPESTRVVLAQEQAVSVAWEYLAELALEAGGLTSAELRIVQPDDYWEYEAVNQRSPAWDLPVALESRLAWVVIFDSPWEETVVWIDSETGAPLGGVHTRTMPEGEVRMWRPAPVHTTEVTIRGAGHPGGPAVLAADSAEGARLLSAIAALPTGEAAECETPITLRFSAKERTHLVAYSPEANRLVLLEKQWRGKTIKAKLAWEVSEEVEELLSQYVEQPAPQGHSR